MQIKTLRISAFQVVVVALLALVAVFSLWSFARADGTSISMCVKQTGASYVIGAGFQNQSCKNNEQLLTFNVTGPQGPQGIQGPIGPQGPEGGSAKLYDANDTIIGYVTGIRLGTDEISVLDKNLDVLETVGLDGADIQSFLPVFPTSSANAGEVYYESSNCSGQGYVTGNLTNSAKQSIFYGNTNDSKLYSVDPSVSAPAQLTYQSYGNASVCTVSSDVITGPIPVKNAEAVLNSYVRPFHIGL